MKKSWKKPWISCLLILLLFATGCNGQTSARSQEAERKPLLISGDNTGRGLEQHPAGFLSLKLPVLS